MEIERKFLVERLLQNLSHYPHNEIIQGYFPSLNKNLERRVRKEGHRYFYTIKSNGKLLRQEKEREITKEEFDSFWRLTENRRVEKTRYKIPFSGKTIHLDIYSGRLKGLITAEIEFESKLEAESFKFPEWFGEELTYDNRYKNRNLAINGLPES